jgi:thiamine-monophosphate kinase
MEHSFIAWIKQRSAKLPQVKLGIGDDCAILEATSEELVVTTDSLCEGTHFILAECGAHRAGRKLMAVNLSDLASMAARPVAVFLTLCLPKQSVGDVAAGVFEGVYSLASEFGVAIAGGDTNVWDGPLVLGMTALGTVAPGKAWRRSGAKIGDGIYVTGSLGGSLKAKHLDFTPRLALASELARLEIVNAATDVSDGLGIDMLNLVVASRVGAELNLDSIPISADAHAMAQQSGRSPVDHALGDGEDFELLLTVSPEHEDRLPREIDGVPLTKIGKIVSRTGLWSKDKSGVRQLPPKGYVHGQF